jgi:hypothetical protein
MVDCSLESHVFDLHGSKDNFVQGLFVRFFHTRNIMAGAKIVDFGLNDEKYTNIIYSIASKFREKLPNYDMKTHIYYTSFAIYSAIYVILANLEVLPAEFNPETFAKAGKGSLQ